jgi:hypothetical protein
MNIPDIGRASSIMPEPIALLAARKRIAGTAKSPAPLATIPADTQLELPLTEAAQ